MAVPVRYRVEWRQAVFRPALRIINLSQDASDVADVRTLVARVGHSAFRSDFKVIHLSAGSATPVYTRPALVASWAEGELPPESVDSPWRDENLRRLQALRCSEEIRGNLAVAVGSGVLARARAAEIADLFDRSLLRDGPVGAYDFA